MTGSLHHDRDDAPRHLQLVQAGATEFGVYQDEIAVIVPWQEPTPLPGAPDSVLGVVSIQGRMLTVLDLVALSGGNGKAEKSDHATRQIVALKGDEQLALAVDKVGEAIPATPQESLAQPETASALVLGVLHRENSSTTVLNLQALFPTSIQGRERRRRRF